MTNRSRVAWPIEPSMMYFPTKMRSVLEPQIPQNHRTDNLLAEDVGHLNLGWFPHPLGTWKRHLFSFTVFFPQIYSNHQQEMVGLSPQNGRIFFGSQILTSEVWKTWNLLRSLWSKVRIWPWATFEENQWSGQTKEALFMLFLDEGVMKKYMKRRYHDIMIAWTCYNYI